MKRQEVHLEGEPSSSSYEENAAPRIHGKEKQQQADIPSEQ